MTQDDEQLNINFNESNPFQDALAGGKFSMIIELDPPLEGEADSDNMFTLEKIAEECSRHEEIVGISISDRMNGPTHMASWKLAERLSRISSKPAISHISGQGHDQSSFEEEIASASSAGINNLLLLSGNLKEGEEKYLESTEQLRTCSHKHEKINTGAAVNPFKYSVNSSFAQYLKMIQKINNGAQFITTQAGLDMRKYDELLRFCTHREITVPLIARLSLISHDCLPMITDLQMEPGVPLSREVSSLILRELNEAQDHSSFMNIQLRRLCLQINACALMGYSGVQIKGIKNAVELHQVMIRMRACMEEIISLEQFYQEWDALNQSVSFSPGSSILQSLPNQDVKSSNHAQTGTYYIYKKSELRPVDESLSSDNTDDLIYADFNHPSDFELFRTKLAKKLNLDEKDGSIARLLKKTIAGISDESPADLAKTQFTDLSTCPKKLIHGCCGGTTSDDLCEDGKNSCIHLERIGMAASLNQLDLLEQASD